MIFALDLVFKYSSTIKLDFTSHVNAKFVGFKQPIHLFVIDICFIPMVIAYKCLHLLLWYESSLPH